MANIGYTHRQTNIHSPPGVVYNFNVDAQTDRQTGRHTFIYIYILFRLQFLEMYKYM